MPRQQGSVSREHVQSDFVEADLDAAFTLLYLAETQYLPRDRASARLAIQEAEKAILDGEKRLCALGDADRESLQSQLERMHGVIGRVRAQFP